MKKYILAFALSTLALIGKAQQTPLFSQYMTNYYLLNPAVAGEDNHIILRTGYRTQWVGFEGAPKTYYLSGHTPLQKASILGKRGRSRRGGKKLGGYHAAGAYLYGDKTGPISRTGGNVSYAYHIPFTRELASSVGVTVGAQQYLFDVNKIYLADNSTSIDPVTMGGSRKTVLPDISLGYYLRSETFFAGISMAQALGNKIFTHEQKDMEVSSRLYRHMFFSAGYAFQIDKHLSLMPSTLLKYTAAAPMQADFNVRGIYNFDNRSGRAPDDKVWAGVSYRTQDAIVTLLGLQFMEKYELNYSYDITLSPIRSSSAGSHEISIGYRIARR